MLPSLHRHQVPYLRRQMGIIFQDFRLIPTMTVYENIAFAMHVTNVKRREISDRVEYMLELVHLEDKAKAYPDTLSGGEQQRVAVARALAHGPKLVIADEPTGNIDPELSLEMMELLERVSETGITVVVVTHEHELVRQFHQRVVTLKKGAASFRNVPADKEAIRARAERKERLFETELEPADTAERRRPPYDETFYLFFLVLARYPQSGQALGHDLCVHPVPQCLYDPEHLCKPCRGERGQHGELSGQPERDRGLSGPGV